MKKFIPTLLAIAVFVGLFVWIQTNDFDGKADEEEEVNKEEAVWNIAAEEVETVMVEREEGILAFQKDNGAWQATEPQAFPVKASTVDTLISAVAGMEGEPVQKGELDVADFGLKDPAATVNMTYGDGQSAELLIGEETPVDQKRYVQVKGADTVYIVHSFRVDQLFNSADTFMDTTVWKLDNEKLQTLTFIWEGETITLTKEGDDWQADGKTLSANKVGSIVRSLNSLASQGLPAEEKPEGQDFQLVAETEQGSEEWIGTVQDEQIPVQKKGGEWIYPLAKEDVHNVFGEINDVLKEREEEHEDNDSEE